MDDMNRFYRSPKAAEMKSSRISNKDSMGSPKSSMIQDNNMSFSELKSKYSWALNTIELLKLEKNNLKSTLDLAMHEREQDSSPSNQKYARQGRANDNLEHENGELKGMLDHHKSKLHSLQKENKKLHEKFSEIERIQLYNSQLRNEMIGLNSELVNISVNARIKELEEENEYLLQDTKSASTQPQLSKYIDQTLHFLNGFDDTHYARICFDQHFGRLDLKQLIDSKNYNLIALKAFKYVTDLLLNVKPRSPSKESKSGSKYQLIGHSYEKAKTMTERPQDPSKNSSYTMVNIYDPSVTDFNTSRQGERFAQETRMNPSVGAGLIRPSNDRSMQSDYNRSTNYQQSFERDTTSRENINNYSYAERTGRETNLSQNPYEQRKSSVSPSDTQKRKTLSTAEYYRREYDLQNSAQRSPNSQGANRIAQTDYMQIQEPSLTEFKVSSNSIKSSSKKANQTEFTLQDTSDFSGNEGRRGNSPLTNKEHYLPQPAFIPRSNPGSRSNNLLYQGSRNDIPSHHGSRVENPNNLSRNIHPNEGPNDISREQYYADVSYSNNSFKMNQSQQFAEHPGQRSPKVDISARSSEKKIIGRRNTEINPPESQMQNYYQQQMQQQQIYQQNIQQQAYQNNIQQGYQQPQQQYQQPQNQYNPQQQYQYPQQQYQQPQQQYQEAPNFQNQPKSQNASYTQYQQEENQATTNGSNSRMRHNPSFGMVAQAPEDNQQQLFFYSQHQNGTRVNFQEQSQHSNQPVQRQIEEIDYNAVQQMEYAPKSSQNSWHGNKSSNNIPYDMSSNEGRNAYLEDRNAYVDGARIDHQSPKNLNLLDKIQLIASQNIIRPPQSQRSDRKRGPTESNTDMSQHYDGGREESPNDRSDKSFSRAQGSEKSLKPILKQDPKFSNSNIEIIDPSQNEEMLLPATNEFETFKQSGSQPDNDRFSPLNASQRSERGRKIAPQIPSLNVSQQQHQAQVEENISPVKSGKRDSPEPSGSIPTGEFGSPQASQHDRENSNSTKSKYRNVPSHRKPGSGSQESLSTPKDLKKKNSASKIYSIESEKQLTSPLDKINETPDSFNTKSQTFKRYSANTDRTTKSSIMAEIKNKGSKEPRNSNYSTYSVVFGKTESIDKKETSPENKSLYILDVDKRKKVDARSQQYDPIRGEEIKKGPKQTNLLVIEPLRDDSLSTRS